MQSNHKPTKLLRRGVILFITTVATSLSSCAGVEIKDHELCGSLAAAGAACFHTLTDETRRMTLQEFAEWWDDLKDPKFAGSVDVLVDIKSSIEKLCSDHTGACSYEVQAKVDGLSSKVGAMVNASKTKPLHQTPATPVPVKQ